MWITRMLVKRGEGGREGGEGEGEVGANAEIQSGKMGREWGERVAERFAKFEEGKGGGERCKFMVERVSNLNMLESLRERR